MTRTSRWARQIVIVLAVALVVVGATLAILWPYSTEPDALTAPRLPAGADWHTPPHRWSRPREIYRPLAAHYSSRLAFQRMPPGPQLEPKNHSANGGYWFNVHQDERRDGEPRFSTLTIFNERPYRLVLRLTESKSVNARWINDKIIYLEIWWSETIGTYALVDVEDEAIVRAEMIQSGNQAYLQSQQPSH